MTPIRRDEIQAESEAASEVRSLSRLRGRVGEGMPPRNELVERTELPQKEVRTAAANTVSTPSDLD